MTLQSRSSARLTVGLLGLVGASLFGTACRSAPGDPSSHWNIDSVDNRVVQHFTGYRGGIDGPYVDFQAQKKRDVNLTLRRHFLSHNPDNPFQPADPSRHQIAPPHGLRPNPLGWFGVESLFFGAATLVWGGTFIPLPLDSLFALGTSEGRSQFSESLTASFHGNDSGWEPPPTRTFKVKHR